MAKPKTDRPPAAAVHALLDAERRIAVRVTPGARGEGVDIDGARLLVKVRAKPEDGKATAAAQALLAAALGVATSRLRLLRGATSREKLFQLD